MKTSIPKEILNFFRKYNIPKEHIVPNSNSLTYSYPDEMNIHTLDTEVPKELLYFTEISDLNLDHSKNLNNLQNLRNIKHLNYLSLSNTAIENLKGLENIDYLGYLNIMKCKNFKTFDGLNPLAKFSDFSYYIYTKELPSILEWQKSKHIQEISKFLQSI